jgi:general secretion pathway protein C
MKTMLTLVNLALIFFVAHFSVSAFYGYIAGKLESAETLDMAQIGTFTPDPKEFLPQSQYSQVTKRDLFNTNFIKPPPAKKIEPAEKNREKEIQLTQLKLELKGTITGTGSEPLAVINKKGDVRQMLYARGDAIEQAIIKTIEKGKVILLVNGREEVLMMETRKSSGPAPATPVARETVGTQEGFVETVDLTWDDVTVLREKMPDIRNEIRVRPYVIKGKMGGFRVTNIKKDSLLYTKLGLRNGDVISGVNDSELRSVQDVARIYEGFDLADGQFDSDVRIRRNGKSGKIQYSIR